jgi:hypothetical protein
VRNFSKNPLNIYHHSNRADTEEEVIRPSTFGRLWIRMDGLETGTASSSGIVQLTAKLQHYQC